MPMSGLMPNPDTPALQFELMVEADGWPPQEKLTGLCERAFAAAQAVLSGHGNGEVCMMFTDDAAMAELNAQFRGKSKPTNVLSFPAHESDMDRLGDIALGRETVFREAEEKGIRVEDHIAHLVIHGFLHLAGYDHETEMEAEEMEAIEREALSRIGIADPYMGETQ